MVTVPMTFGDPNQLCELLALG